jgi:uncharacterized RDD family membrane protein YckC
MHQDATYRLETPDNVELHFDLAGPGSRFCAICIDAVVVGGTLLTLVLVAIVIDAALPGALSAIKELKADRGLFTSVGVAVVLFGVAVINASYHLIFELFWRGQTPGKRVMKIRAISDDGTPMGPTQVLLRNVLRIVDFLPAAYALGGVVCLVSDASKRLGDFAAGTIVVKEGAVNYRAKTDTKNAPLAAPALGANPELLPDESRLVQNFLSRRAELLPLARGRLAEQIAGPLYDRYGGNWDYAESYLERLAAGRHRDK